MIRLEQGDCLEVMDRLISEGVKVDAIITDPPYGTMKGAEKTGIYGSKNNPKHDWDEKIDIEKMMLSCVLLLRNNGIMTLFSQDPYTTEIKVGSVPSLPFVYSYIWEKDSFAFALGAKKAPVNVYEEIVVFRKRHPKHDFSIEHPLREYFAKVYSFINLSKKVLESKFGGRVDHVFRFKSSQFSLCTSLTYSDILKEFDFSNQDWFLPYEELKKIDLAFTEELRDKMTSENPSIFNLWDGQKHKKNILKYGKDKSAAHPTQKPILLVEDLIKTYTLEGDTVLDFTMGSGTTGVACKNLGRNFIGIELDKNYFEIAQERIKGV
jgi:DNA modification methylase